MMLAAALLAVQLAGGQPAETEDVQVLPIGRPFNELVPSLPPVRKPGIPASLEISAGWASATQIDPYGRFGPAQFRLPGPTLGAAIRGDAWYAEFAGRLARSSLNDRNLSAAVARDLFHVGPIRVGLSLEGTEIRFRREDFRTADVLIGTSRTATMVLTGVTLGAGSYRSAAFRVAALGGWYQNRYGSIVELPAFSGDEPLADDEVPIVGAVASVQRLNIAGRVILEGSARYLRVMRPHASSVPDDELSGSLGVQIRILGVRRKQLFLGGIARFGPAGPSLATDKTFGLRGIWKFK